MDLAAGKFLYSICTKLNAHGLYLCLTCVIILQTGISIILYRVGNRVYLSSDCQFLMLNLPHFV